MHVFSAITISIVSINALTKGLGDINHLHLGNNVADTSDRLIVEHKSDLLCSPLYILNSAIVERVLKFIQIWA